MLIEDTGTLHWPACHFPLIVDFLAKEFGCLQKLDILVYNFTTNIVQYLCSCCLCSLLCKYLNEFCWNIILTLLNVYNNMGGADTIHPFGQPQTLFHMAIFGILQKHLQTALNALIWPFEHFEAYTTVTLSTPAHKLADCKHCKGINMITIRLMDACVCRRAEVHVCGLGVL